MQIKIKKDDCEYEGDPDHLIQFFKNTKVDVPSLLNAPKEYSCPNYFLWGSGIFYFISLIVCASVGDGIFRHICSITCMVCLLLSCVFVYIKLKKSSLCILIFLAGMIVYLFSVNTLSNSEIKELSNRGINKYLPSDSIR